MQAGTLRKRLIFLTSATSTQDAVGEVVPTWTKVATVWASIKPLNGRQLALAQANSITSTATHEIRIRFNNAIVGQLNLRIQYGNPNDGPFPNRFYRINSILDPDERHRELRLTVTEVAA